MTQAELAGGTTDARQPSPAKGQLIRDFTLTSTLGQEISLSDYRGRSNLVLVFVGESVGNPDRNVLAEIAADHSRFLDEQTQVLAIMQCTQERAARIRQEANLPFPLLVDENGRIHRSAGAADKSGQPAIAIYITDRFGEVFAVVPGGRRADHAKRAGNYQMANLYQYPVSGVWPSRVAGIATVAFRSRSREEITK